MEGTERERDRDRDVESHAGSYGGGIGRGRGGSALTDDLEISIYDMRRDNLRDDCSGTSTLSVEAQIKLEADNAIKYRTCSWHKTAALLFSEYICLAILSFPWSYAALGMVPGLILTIFVALTVLYTSLVLCNYCLRHPQLRDAPDVGQRLFWNSEWAWWFTAIMFVLNNIFIMGLHVLVGAKYFNTMTGHNMCTVSFMALSAVIQFVLSLPRTFDSLSFFAAFSAFFTFVSVFLTIVFSGVQDHPVAWDGFTNPIVTAFPQAGTGFVYAMTGFLNISYTFIGQITIPSFMAEMKRPEDFPKALYAVTVAEIILFTLAGALIYKFTGDNYVTSPAVGSLQPLFKKIAFTFMVPTIIFLGVLYASVSARFVFFRIFHDSKHKGNHTILGWGTWTGILFVMWLIAYFIAELIPFFGDLLSLMSSLFDSFFGFIFWGVAWIRMRQEDYPKGWISGLRGMERPELLLNIFLIVVGFLFLTAGTYTTVQSIIWNFQADMYGGIFSCMDNSI